MSEEKLEKGLTGLVAAAALASAPSSGPSKDLMSAFDRAQSKPAHTETKKAAPAAPKFDPKTLHPDMHGIAFLESSYGKKMDHAPNAKGEFDTAYGPLGFKPSTAFDEFSKSPHLLELHPNLKDKEAFSQAFKTNPQFYNLVAGAHWNRLKKQTGSSNGAAFAWRWGMKNYHTAQPQARASDDYVQKYSQAMASSPWAMKKAEPNDYKLLLSKPTMLSKAQEQAKPQEKTVDKIAAMLEGVKSSHGFKAAFNLSENLYNHIPESYKVSLKEYMSHKTQKVEHQDFYKEHLSGLLDYLNNESSRMDFHKAKGHLSDEEIANKKEKLNPHYQKFERNMKGAFQALKHAASRADGKWLKGRVEKKLSKSEFDLDGDMHEVAEAMGGLPSTQSKEFKAAHLISNFEPTDEDIKHAYHLWEDDFEAYALAAHRIEVNEDSRQKLKDTMKNIGPDLKKSDDFMIMSIPREVLPYDRNSEKLVVIAQNAFDKNNVKSVELNGKHSHGSAVLYDDISDSMWFLKPGSGELSSAAGVAETVANQSRREVAFNTIGSLIGLGEFLPEAGLILLDHHEVAMLEFFSDYVSLNKLKKVRQPIDPIFERYVPDGTIHRLAALDYILGQTDRHAGNVLFKEGKFKLIDAGSAFAGHGFSPGRDPKTYIPIYLRAFTTFRFSKMGPLERVSHMPKPAFAGESSLSAWVAQLPLEQITNLLKEYGIDPTPVVDRIKALQGWSGNKSDFLNKFWAGLI